VLRSFEILDCREKPSTSLAPQQAGASQIIDDSHNELSQKHGYKTIPVRGVERSEERKTNVNFHSLLSVMYDVTHFLMRRGRAGPTLCPYLDRTASTLQPHRCLSDVTPFMLRRGGTDPYLDTTVASSASSQLFCSDFVVVLATAIVARPGPLTDLSRWERHAFFPAWPRDHNGEPIDNDSGEPTCGSFPWKETYQEPALVIP